MKVRVFLNNLKIDYTKMFDKAQDYFSRHGLPIEWEFINTNIKKYKVVKENNGITGDRYQLTGHQKQLTLDPLIVSIFAFNGNEFSLKRIPTSKCEFAPEGILTTYMTYTQGVETNENYITLIHEMMHSIRFLLFMKGVLVDDVMDSYYKNNQPDGSDSNFEQQWKLFKPHLHLLTMPTVTITRQKSSKKQTLGVLSTTVGNATFSAKTLELPWVNNQKNVSCIPVGTYQVKWTFSPKFMKYTYEILNVPNRSGIRIHSASFYSDLLGCIALGNALKDINSDGELDTINSRITINAFNTLMDKKPFTLIIK